MNPVEPMATQCTEAEGVARERALRRVLARAASAPLDLLVTKPIAIFVWWLSERANATRFHGRRELARRVRRALQEGRPVLFASNHVSMFDDPVVPMALFRTGPRAAMELLLTTALLVVWAAAPTDAPGVAALVSAVVAAGWGARKTWWSLGDLANFSGAAALRGRLETDRRRPPRRPVRGLLALADPTIRAFMRSGVVKTIFVDRRSGEEARRSRARVVAQAIDVAGGGEPVWIFPEGGRARNPDEIGPARHGVGEVVLGLRARGLEPLVFAIHQRGLERVIPRGTRRWLTAGHRVDVRWMEVSLRAPNSGPEAAPELAGQVGAALLRLQSAWRAAGG